MKYLVIYKIDKHILYAKFSNLEAAKNFAAKPEIEVMEFLEIKNVKQ